MEFIEEKYDYVIKDKSLDNQLEQMRKDLPICLSYHMHDLNNRANKRVIEKALLIRDKQMKLQQEDPSKTDSHYSTRKTFAFQQCADILNMIRKFEKEKYDLKEKLGEAGNLRALSSTNWAIDERHRAFKEADKEYKALHGYGFFERLKYTKILNNLYKLKK